MTMDRRRFLELCAAVGLPTALASDACADLAGYALKADPSFSWKRVTRETFGGGTIHRLRLTSQTWQGTVWEHDLCLYLAAGGKLTETIALYNTGGGANRANDTFGMEIAKRSRTPIVFLYNVPNQPLFGGKVEDALIAETFLRYLKTGDESWPLLFAMVKSVVRAMDAIQAYAKKELDSNVKQFVISGASKRGWTSWLTAASGDKRVKAIAPMVIDTLNMPAQMKHQKEHFGTTSEQIKDYAENGLTDVLSNPAGKRLVELVDPYSYRRHLTLPKMLIHGANDPYWTVDAIRLYWDQLPGQKWVCCVPNAGHNLTERTPGLPANTDRAVNTLSAFIYSQSHNAKMPQLHIREQENEQEPVYTLEVETDQPIKEGRVWIAQSETPDFREKTWEAKSIDEGGDQKNRRFVVPCPEKGYSACFAELRFAQADRTFTLCTPPKLLTARILQPVGVGRPIGGDR